MTYFNLIWCRSRSKNTAAQHAELMDNPWKWQDLATYPTL
ncbi:hypothetical protein AM1_5287 [Acaryochloris marina MBIC11017]|uniref:Uncharacterized protein n=1 Tax=Acaryochloris marina (strain MBIC 11017) TaxID=329726 RepID=B0CAP7_ACAM1|nr:hypothetical protein AM1_5287 [Acaryochloris marina MBIC11017]